MKIFRTFVLICFFVTNSAGATTVIYQNMNDLQNTSDIIVTGTISKIKSKYHKKKDIFTTITLVDASEITEDGLMSINHKVRVRHMGGVIEEFDDKGKMVKSTGSIIAGTPRFEEGQQVIFYLTENGIRPLPFSGFTQGIFTINEVNEIQDSDGKAIIGLNGYDLIKRRDKSIYIAEWNVKEKEALNYNNFKNVKKDEFFSIIKEMKINKKIRNKTKSYLQDLPSEVQIPELTAVAVKAPPMSAKQFANSEENH